ncbi:serpin B4-like [Rhinophrynus dorsalis]
MDSLCKSILCFTIDIYKELIKEEHKNIFISPYSISSAVAMILLGAKGNTAEQIEKVFHFPKSVSSGQGAPGSEKEVCQTGGIHQAFKQFLLAIKQQDCSYELDIANRIYGQKDYEFSKKYLQCLEELYKAGVEAVDFQKNAEVIRQQINSWVEKNTNGKIKDLFPKDSISPSSVMVMVNAVYFKGKWKLQFKKENTKDGIFHMNKNEKKTVKMMFQSGKFRIASVPDLKSQIIELPYERDMSMYIVLPDKVDGLKELQNNITCEKVINLAKSDIMKEGTVNVHIPQMTIEQNYEDLPKVLKAMGMTDVFAANADLTGMSTKGRLTLSRLVHKCYINVNEEGTEAAAATGGGIVPLSMPIIHEFNVDHPFMCYIKHTPTNCLLFFGSITSP